MDVGRCGKIDILWAQINLNMNKYFWLLLISVISACTHQQKNPAIPVDGIWRGLITTRGKEIPFNFRMEKYPDQGFHAYLINGEEEIHLPEVLHAGDSLIFPMHIFDAEIRARYKDGVLQGVWTKKYVEGYNLPFHATYNDNYRFTENPIPGEVNISGNYRVQFIRNGNSSLALGVFEQEGYRVTGTFLTPTGDYRYLDGEINEDRLFLSAFDGEHAYLFEADLFENRMEGEFWSGKTGYSTWIAHRDETFELPDPDSLTGLKEGYERLFFTLPDLDGNPVTLSDEKYNGKVVIVQIFGTWCPNCMDETRFLADYYKRNQYRDFEIIGLAFENKDDFEYARQRIKRVVELMNVGYDFLIAGKRSRDGVEKALPMLKNFMSYPTMIFIDRKGEVRKIHTGFSGPGTGRYYEEFVEEFNRFMDTLLDEKVK